jgi:DNA-binding CsgD family transcriptional regulator
VVARLRIRIKPDEGSARIFGADPRRYQTRRMTGAMLQTGSVPPAASEALERGGVASIANRRFGDLSGGQQQRALFALAICGDPRLLVLDEPTNNLDIEARRLLWHAIRSFVKDGRIGLPATHEAVTKVVRHAGARSVRLVLRAKNGRCNFEIVDDGRGGGSDGAGLRGMRERVEALGRARRRGRAQTRPQQDPQDHRHDLRAAGIPAPGARGGRRRLPARGRAGGGSRACDPPRARGRTRHRAVHRARCLERARSLSDRERAVLRLAAGGRTGSAIGAELGLSEGTVRNYLSVAIGKTGGANRVEAARIARERGRL